MTHPTTVILGRVQNRRSKPSSAILSGPPPAAEVEASSADRCSAAGSTTETTTGRGFTRRMTRTTRTTGS